MRLIIIGCEYAGKTTLSEGLREWMINTFGSCGTSFHDHFLPWSPNDAGIKAATVESELKLLTLDDTSLLEQFCRYILHYHTHPSFYSGADHGVVNWFYGDAVYAPLYYGFGGPDVPTDRVLMARNYEASVMKEAPDTVLVLLTARPEIIRQRREQDPNPGPYPRDQDIDLVLRRFDEEYRCSLIRNRIHLDTSDTTAAETLQDFLRQVEPMLTSDDRLRMLTRRQG